LDIEHSILDISFAWIPFSAESAQEQSPGLARLDLWRAQAPGYEILLPLSTTAL
jgi:hypothetical protein